MIKHTNPGRNLLLLEEFNVFVTEWAESDLPFTWPARSSGDDVE